MKHTYLSISICMHIEMYIIDLAEVLHCDVSFMWYSSARKLPLAPFPSACMEV
jgi:hypothetical protein